MMPITLGDNVSVPYFSGELVFTILAFKPEMQVAVISQDTEFRIVARDDNQAAPEEPKD